jgi:hypothetical protein
MFHLRCYWIVVCSVSLLLTSCGGKKTAEVIKSESQKSVALISHLKGHGVGFFIEGTAGVCTVLTAKHVVPDGKEISILTMTSKLPFKPLDIRRADNADLAVVTFKPLDGNCPFPALKLGDSKDIVLTQPIYISSYPGGVNGQAPKQSFYISSVSDKTPGGDDGYELGYKTDTLGGTSGSPVLNEFAEVIAVHGRSYMNKDSNLLVNSRAYLDLGVPINIYKQDVIDQVNKLSSTDERKLTSKIDQSVLSSNTNWLIVWGVLIGSAIIIIVIATIKFKHSKTTYRKPVVDRYAQTIPNLHKIKPLYPPDSNLLKKKEVIPDYNRISKRDPNSTTYYNRGVVKSNLGNQEEAVADYDIAIKLDPSNSNAYYNRGIAKLDLGNKEDAKADYKKSAGLYLQQGRRKGYQNALKRIKELGI